MEKNVINSFFVALWVLILCLFPKATFCFQKLLVEEVMYSIINSSIQYSSEKKIRILNKTLPYENWMDEVWNKDNFDEQGAGFCLFEDSELEKAFWELKIKVKSLTEKTLLESKLEDRFKMKSNEKAGLILAFSEPIIIGDFSFIFRKTQSTTSLYVQRKDANGIWDYECGVPISGVLH